MYKTKLKIISVLITLLFFSFITYADVRLPEIIGNSMVLQQKESVPIWGFADAGESVTVKFGQQTKTVIADANGKWRVNLDALKADFTPKSMTIAGKNKIELKDILVGEVWLISGQSNMERPMSWVDNSATEIAAADHPNLRLFTVSHDVAFKVKSGVLGNWQACTPAYIKNFSGAGYYFGVELENNLKVPIGLINSSYGGSQAEAWTPFEYLNASDILRPTVEKEKIWAEQKPKLQADYDEQLKKWQTEADKAKTEGKKEPNKPGLPDGLRPFRIASSIYNGMIVPIIPYKIKGAVWYQGESNEARAEQYKTLLPTMIKSWRERWGQGNFPFGIVQLTAYRTIRDYPEETGWSFIREYQRTTALTTKNSGLIVTIDIGNPDDVHPTNKMDVGKRMASWAFKDVYGEKPTLFPMFQKAEIKGSKMIITFSEVGTGLKIKDGDKLDEFAIAGADKKFVWAEAKIIAKNKIEVSSLSVPNPLAVRYAFNSSPKHPNLTNETGLPASPFRTDDWADATAGKR
jgi:sialate O-acetylesterase